MNYFKNRIKAIAELSKEKNFAPAVFISGKAIIMISFFLAIQTGNFLNPLEISLDRILVNNSFLLFSSYVGILVISAGREIIMLHLFAFSRLDSIIRKSIDAYNIRHWKKNKKDSEFLSRFAAIQSRIFRPILAISPRKRNVLVFGPIMTYLIIDYMRFGLLQILAIHLGEVISEQKIGIHVFS